MKLKGGQSITIGNEYSIYKKDNFQDKIFNFNIATSLSDNDNEDLQKRQA